MLKWDLNTISVASAIIPAIFAIIRLSKVDKVFYPFMFMVIIAALFDYFPRFIMGGTVNPNISSNIFVLCEALLLTLYFKNAGVFSRSNVVFKVIIALFILIWIFETSVHGDLKFINSYYRIITSLCIVFMSITAIKRLMMIQMNKVYANRDSVIRNAMFLIPVGTVVFFTFKLLVEIFWVYGIIASADFQADIYRIVHAINLATNLIFVLAILWMPRKQDYILLS